MTYPKNTPVYLGYLCDGHSPYWPIRGDPYVCSRHLL